MKSRGCMSDAFSPSWLVPSRGAQETQLIKAKPTSESTLTICFTTTKVYPTRSSSKSRLAS